MPGPSFFPRFPSSVSRSSGSASPRAGERPGKSLSPPESPSQRRLSAWVDQSVEGRGSANHRNRQRVQSVLNRISDPEIRDKAIQNYLDGLPGEQFDPPARMSSSSSLGDDLQLVEDAEPFELPGDDAPAQASGEPEPAPGGLDPAVGRFSRHSFESVLAQQAPGTPQQECESRFAELTQLTRQLGDPTQRAEALGRLEFTAERVLASSARLQDDDRQARVLWQLTDHLASLASPERDGSANRCIARLFAKIEPACEGLEGHPAVPRILQAIQNHARRMGTG